MKKKSKKEKVVAALKANPHLSNTAIARATKASTRTVGQYRRTMEAAGELPYIKERIGVDGRKGRGPEPYRSAPPMIVRVRCPERPEPVQPLQNETQPVPA